MSEQRGDAMTNPPPDSHMALAAPVAGATSTHTIGFGIRDDS
jgi:hypothetical protein